MGDFYGSVIGGLGNLCKPLSKYRAYRIILYLIAFFILTPLSIVLLFVINLIVGIAKAVLDTFGAAVNEYALIPRIWKAERNWNNKKDKP